MRVATAAVEVRNTVGTAEEMMGEVPLRETVELLDEAVDLSTSRQYIFE